MRACIESPYGLIFSTFWVNAVQFLSVRPLLIGDLQMQKIWIPLLSIAIGTICLPSVAADIYVSPQGSDLLSGNSSDTPIQTIQTAVDKAKPGDTINLAPGQYLQDIVTKIDGTQSQPITITGSADAIVKGGGKGRIIDINHNFIVLNGFTIDGLHGNANSVRDYREKLVYVQGQGKQSGVEGLKINNMRLRNAGGECVRLRYFAKNNEIAFNTIENCGVYDFQFGGMKKKNGEGIYIGTVPEQLNDGKNPTTDIDVSWNNWIHHNTIKTRGNECVDIKEGSRQNTVEYNICTGQKDPESAGLDSRGSENIFRYNEIFKNEGAGVRLGGDTPKDGNNNQVYGNNIYDNASGGIKIQAENQQQICNNIMNNNTGGDSVGFFGKLFSPTDNCAFSK